MVVQAILSMVVSAIQVHSTRGSILAVPRAPRSTICWVLCSANMSPVFGKNQFHYTRNSAAYIRFKSTWIAI